LGGGVRYAVMGPGSVGSTVSGLNPAGTRTFLVDDGEAAIDLDVVGDVIEGPGVSGLIKAGSGVLRLGGTNSYTGPTTVNAGTLIVDGSVTAAVAVNGGRTLAGSGTTGSPLVPTGGRVTPGRSPGILNTGAVSFASGAVLSLEVNGTTAGTQHDQLNVT